MPNQLDIIDIQDKLGYVDTGSLSEEATAPITAVASSSTADLIIKEPKPQTPYTAYVQPHQNQNHAHSKDDDDISIYSKGKEKEQYNNHQPQPRKSRFVPVKGNGSNNNESQRDRPRITSISLPATTMNSPQKEDSTQDVMVSKLNEIADMLKILTIQQQQQQQQTSHTPSPAATITSPAQHLRPVASRSEALRRKTSKGKLPNVYYNSTPHRPSPERKRHNNSVDGMFYRDHALEPPTPIPSSSQPYPYTQRPHQYTYTTIESQKPILTSAPQHHYYSTNSKSRKTAALVPYYGYNDDEENDDEEDHEQLYDHHPPYYHHRQPNYYYEQRHLPPVAPISYAHYEMMNSKQPSLPVNYHTTTSSDSKAYRQRRKSFSNAHDAIAAIPQQQPFPTQRKRSRKTSVSKKGPTFVHMHDYPPASEQQILSHQYAVPPHPYHSHAHYPAPVRPPPPPPHQYSPTTRSQYGYYI